MKKVKKLSSFVLVILIALSVMMPATLANTADVKFVINGKPYVTPKGEPAPYVNKDYRTLVPVRFFADALGLKTNWDQETMTATLSHSGNKVQITLGDNRIYVNGKTVYMDTRAELKNGRTFIPARFIAESFGGKIGFENATNTVSIDLTESDMPKQEKPDQLAETDPYGRKIRTTNLPKNYADFPYILEDIPNEMYEMEYTVLNESDFLTPKDFYGFRGQVTKENIDIWVERSTNYFDLILNVDYKTIDYTWGDKLWDNMSQGVNEEYTRKKFRDYVNWVKENKIVIKGSVKPEPSFVYDAGLGSRVIRAEVEFTVLNYDKNENIMYGIWYNFYKDQIKKGVTYKGYFDIELVTNHMTSDWGPLLAVSSSTEIFRHFSISGLKSIYD